MFLLAVSTFRQRWPLFVGAIVTVCLGVALVQSSLLTLVTAATATVPPGLAEAAATALRDGYAAAASLLGIVVGLSAFLAIFIVASTFAFTVAQRRRELALLRLAGASRGQLRKLLLGEATVLSVVGTASGIAVGLPVMRFEGWLIDRLGFAPDGFMGQWRGWIVAVSVGTGVGIALLGVLAASGRAARIRPLEALRETGQARRVMNWSRWLLGLLFAAGAVTLMILVPAVGGEGALAMSIFVCVLLVVAFTAFSPLLVPLVSAVLSLFTLHTTLGRLAGANLGDAVRRSASTASPIIVLAAFVAAIAGTLATTAEAGRQEATRTLSADLVVTSNSPIATRLAAVPGVRVVSEEAQIPFRLESSGADAEAETVAAGSIDPATYLTTHRISPIAGDLRDLHGPSIAVRPSLAPDGSWRVGGTVPARIDGTPAKLRIVALLPETFIGPAYLLPSDLVPAAKNSPRSYAVQADGRAEAAIRARFGTASVAKKDAWIRQLDQEQQQTNLKVNVALLGLAAVYTLIAIVNAVVISAADRVEEFHTHRVTGLTRGQVVRMALYEAFTIAAAGLVIGVLAAASTLVGIMVSIADIIGFSVLAVPIAPLIALALTVTAVVGITSVLTTMAATRPARLQSAE